MRKLKIYVSVLLILCVTIGGASVAGATPQDVRAKASILIECDTGKVLYEKNPDVKLPIASVTKIMTLCVIFDRMEAGGLTSEDKVLISSKAVGIGGSHVFLDVNEYYTAQDMIKSIIIASANDACIAMAEHIGGSEESFVELMNQKAQSLGMENTRFSNCTGMPIENHYSTARDVSIMSRELMNHEMFFKWSHIWMDELQHKDGRITGLTNTNRLVRFFDGCDGIKTGYTQEAGHCVSATVKRGNMRLISVIIGGETSQKRFDDARDLINYGFANFKKIELVDPTQIPECLSLKNGMSKSITIAPEGNASILLEKTEENNVEAQLSLPDTLQAPISKGDVIGKIVFTINGQEIASVNIVATEDGVEATLGEYFKKLIECW